MSIKLFRKRMLFLLTPYALAQTLQKKRTKDVRAQLIYYADLTMRSHPISLN